MSKQELIECLIYEKRIYINDIRDYFKKKFSNNEKYFLWKYQMHLRKAEYYYNCKKGLVDKFLFCYHINRKNKIGNLLGIYISINTIDKGLVIYHSGQIVVSGLARCGKNFKLHGNNCIGNKGIDGVAPVIGDNCDVGFGAVIIGDLKIGNNVTIGANAVVNKSFEEGVVVGIPAYKVK